MIPQTYPSNSFIILPLMPDLFLFIIKSMPKEKDEIVPLTDPVVEDISKDPPPPLPDSPPADPPKPKDTTPDPVQTPPPPPPPTIKPATPPKSNKNLTTISLIIITLLAVAGASLFYNQNQQLKKEIQDLTNTLEAQKTLPTPEITSKPSEPTSETPQSTNSAITTFTITPTATPQTKTEAQQALDLAQEKYPQAQLILITSDNPHLEDQKVTKYWFRQSETDKKYLYVSFSNGQLNLVDQQVYVSPDNHIPSLNQRLKEGKLGLTLEQVLSLTNSLCKEPETCQKATAIKTQFLDTSTHLLWQVTYQIKDQPQPLVFQIDSLTKEVVYQSQK